MDFYMFSYFKKKILNIFLLPFFFIDRIQKNNGKIGKMMGGSILPVHLKKG